MRWLREASKAGFGINITMPPVSLLLIGPWHTSRSKIWSFRAWSQIMRIQGWKIQILIEPSKNSSNWNGNKSCSLMMQNWINRLAMNNRRLWQLTGNRTSFNHIGAEAVESEKEEHFFNTDLGCTSGWKESLDFLIGVDWMSWLENTTEFLRPTEDFLCFLRVTCTHSSPSSLDPILYSSQSAPPLHHRIGRSKHQTS